MPAAAFGQPNLQDLLALLYASQGQGAPIGGLQSTSGKSRQNPVGLGQAPAQPHTPSSPYREPGEDDQTLGLSEGAPLPNPNHGGGFALPWNTPTPGAGTETGATTGTAGTTGAAPGAGAEGGGFAGGGGTFEGGGATAGWGGTATGAGAGGAAGGAGGLGGLLGHVNWGRLALAAAALLAGSQGGAPAGGGTTTTRRGGGGGGGGGGSKVPLAPPVPYEGIQHHSQFVGYQPIQPFTLGGGPTNFVSGAGSSTPARPPTPPPPAAKPEGKRPPRSNSNPRPNRPGGPGNGPQNRTPNTAPQGVDQAALMQFLASLMQMQRPGGVGGQSQGGG